MSEYVYLSDFYIIILIYNHILYNKPADSPFMPTHIFKIFELI